MTIEATDVKFQKSERMTDNSDGGGEMTADQVVDNEVGNVFPKISRINRTTGDVSLMEIFLHVATQNTDVLSGGHVIITQDAADPLVHLMLFDPNTGGATDRATAANFVENYVVAGPITGLRLWDKQVDGARAILLFGSTDTPLPLVGDVLCLSVENVNYPAHAQFVRVISVDVHTQTFSKNTQNIIQLGISVPLDQDYPGDDPDNESTVSSAITKVRNTEVADAARYYGITSTTAELTPGTKIIPVASVYGQLVPATTSETPMVGQLPNGAASAVVEAGNDVTFSVGIHFTGETRFLGSPVTPGTLSFTVDGVSYQDQSGSIVPVATGPWTGSIDYPSGALFMQLPGNGSGGSSTVAGTFKPGGVTNQSPYSDQVAVDQNTRRYNYTFSLRPLPAPGTVRISYRALGRWYDIVDDGRGGLRGVIAGTGSGTVNYGTGNVIATLGALPDVGTDVIAAWGQVQTYNKQVGVITVAKPVIEVDGPAGKAIEAGTVTITWNDGTARTATDNGSGTITGDATGVVIYWAADASTGGSIKFSPNILPPKGTNYSVEYSTGTTVKLLAQPGTITGTTMAGTIGPAPIKPKTVHIAVPVNGTQPPTGYWADPSITDSFSLSFHDDGAGNLVRDFDGANKGTINYATGDWSADTEFTATQSQTLLSYSSSAPG